MKKPPKWMKLDNAALIYPAAARRNWNALFRVSAHIDEPVDPTLLDQALASTLRRFPGFSSRLRRGMFWYYLEHLEGHPPVQPDVNNPCVRMKPSENGGFLFRVRYYHNRIALETYHVLADGTGGLCFLKTLVAEYLRLRDGCAIPRDNEILDCAQAPQPEEYEDGFTGNTGRWQASRREANSYHITGTDEPDGFCHITTGLVPADAVLSRAREKGVSLTEYLVAVQIQAIDALQRRECRNERRLKPVKVNVPVNLRRFFPSRTMRNFASYVNPGIEPKYGEYSFDEILMAVHHFMGAEVTPKNLTARITTNVRSERNPFLRVMPLFIKNIAMKTVYNFVGDSLTASSFSNLGAISLPPEMERHVTRMDFILGPLSSNRVVLAGLSYRGTLYLNFTRTIREPLLEREFFTRLVKLGIPVKIESNQR